MWRYTASICLLSRCCSASRLREASNAQTTSVRPCSSRRTISTAIRSTAPSTPSTCSAPTPSIDTVDPSIDAVGTIIWVALWTSSRANSIAAAPCALAADTAGLAELGAEVTVVANVGANEPPASSTGVLS